MPAVPKQPHSYKTRFTGATPAQTRTTGQQSVRGSVTSPDRQKVSVGQPVTGSPKTSAHSGDDLPPEGKFTINYDLGNQFHFEKLLSDGTKVGK